MRRILTSLSAILVFAAASYAGEETLASVPQLPTTSNKPILKTDDEESTQKSLPTLNAAPQENATSLKVPQIALPLTLPALKAPEAVKTAPKAQKELKLNTTPQLNSRPEQKTAEVKSNSLPGFAASNTFTPAPIAAPMAPAVTEPVTLPQTIPAEKENSLLINSQEDPLRRERISNYLKNSETFERNQAPKIEIPINAPINGSFAAQAPVKKSANQKTVQKASGYSLPQAKSNAPVAPKATAAVVPAAPVAPVAQAAPVAPVNVPGVQPEITALPNQDAGSYLVMDESMMTRQPMRNRFYHDFWINGGVTSNATPPITTSAVSGSPAYPGNIDATNLQLNQLYGVVGIETEKADHISFGARADILYGTDYLLGSSVGLETRNTRRETAGGGPAQSVYEATPRWNMTEQGGFPRYGLAMPQLYAEAYLPFLAGLSVKMGHYYSPTGAESVMAPQNFFYSHSYSMLYGTPQTLTGVLATQKLNDNLSILYGVDQGWNTWDSETGDVSLLGGFVWNNNNKDASLSFTIMSGDYVNEIDLKTKDPILKGNMTNYSLVYRKQLNACWRFALEHDFGSFENGSYSINEDQQVKNENANWYTIAGYLIYDYSEKLSYGMRMEWFQDSGYSRWLANPTATRVAGFYETSGTNYYNLTFGANWRPVCGVLLRPEIRYDWSNFERSYQNGHKTYAYDSGSRKDLVTVGCDMTIQF